MLPVEMFKAVVDATPLISIDLLIENEGKYLLGRRANKPAKGYFFPSVAEFSRMKPLTMP